MVSWIGSQATAQLGTQRLRSQRLLWTSPEAALEKDPSSPHTESGYHVRMSAWGCVSIHTPPRHLGNPCRAGLGREAGDQGDLSAVSP